MLEAALSGKELPKRLRAAARFILADPDYVAFNTVAAVSERSGVTGSTYIRLAHAVGFAEMRQILRHHLLARTRRTEGERDRGAAAARLAPVAERIEGAPSRLASMLDEARIDLAAGMLADASTVYLVGTRLAYSALPFINVALNRAGLRNVIAPAILNDEYDVVGFVDRDDVALCVDFSPPTGETLELISLLRGHDVPTIAITDDSLAPLARASILAFGVGDAQTPDLSHLAAAMALEGLLARLAGERRFAARGDA